MALTKGLATLLSPSFSDVDQAATDFAEQCGLLRRPVFVALGLSSHNTTGRLRYTGSTASDKPSYVLPRAGRRSLAYEAEDHAGGAALVTSSVFSALDWEDKYPRSLISVVGGDSDIYASEVLDACAELAIDTDGVDRTARNTWSSTVLVYDTVDSTGSPHKAQRIFLDRGYLKPLVFGPRVRAQLVAQLIQQDLRLVYFDKFLALSYPYGATHRAPELLMEHKRVLDDVCTTRPDVDVLYETGTTGTDGLVVERSFSENINILTCAFPFFCKHVLSAEYKNSLGSGVARFSDLEFSKTDFADERTAILDLLHDLKLSESRMKPQAFVAHPSIVDGARRWARRRNAHRRWLVLTLHELGGLSVDLDTGKGTYASVPRRLTGDVIQNTAGAGDTFRGAFCYALLRCLDRGDQNSAAMAEATKFAVEMASRKCTAFSLQESLSILRKASRSRLRYP